ncbi:MAG: hypothetical protein LBI78_01065 [Campylobacteraceae bacterium]|jgi:outer membrane murein-binding lipoprotein Lpp|nr:hypothetical protein [Campylobacteraceae bacterium]
MVITREAFLTQLGYSVTDSLLKQLEKVSGNTPKFDQISSHIIALNDNLKHYDSFIALSSSHDFLKIKNQSNGELTAQVNELINNWAKKYKIELEKVSGKETFYIKGYEKSLS